MQIVEKNIKKNEKTDSSRKKITQCAQPWQFVLKLMEFFLHR